MTGWLAYDGSDNNNDGRPLTPTFIRQHDDFHGLGPIQLVKLKLYRAPNTWTKQSYANCAGDFHMAFYLADVLEDLPPVGPPTCYARTHEALAFVGVGWNNHPIVLDLAEFLIHRMSAQAVEAYLAAMVELAHADGLKIGDYTGQSYPLGHYPEVGQDFRVIPNYNVPPTHTYDLWQFAAIQGYGDLSRPAPGLTLAGFLAKSTNQAPPPPPKGDDLTPEQAAQLQEVHDWITRPAGEGVAPSDIAGNDAFVAGYRMGYQGEDLPARLSKNPDALAGHTAGAKAGGH